jgi:hypothetical protein
VRHDSARSVSYGTFFFLLTRWRWRGIALAHAFAFTISFVFIILTVPPCISRCFVFRSFFFNKRAFFAKTLLYPMPALERPKGHDRRLELPPFRGRDTQDARDPPVIVRQAAILCPPSDKQEHQVSPVFLEREVARVRQICVTEQRKRGRLHRLTTSTLAALTFLSLSITTRSAQRSSGKPGIVATRRSVRAFSRLAQSDW